MKEKDPYVAEHVMGGHLAPILQTDRYVEAIEVLFEKGLNEYART